MGSACKEPNGKDETEALGAPCLAEGGQRRSLRSDRGNADPPAAGTPGAASPRPLLCPNCVTSGSAVRPPPGQLPWRDAPTSRALAPLLCVLLPYLSAFSSVAVTLGSLMRTRLPPRTASAAGSKATGRARLRGMPKQFPLLSGPSALTEWQMDRCWGCGRLGYLLSGGSTERPGSCWAWLSMGSGLAQGQVLAPSHQV